MKVSGLRTFTLCVLFCVCSAANAQNFTCTSEPGTKKCLTVDPTKFWIVGEIRAFAFGGDANSKIVSELHKAGWLECEGQSLDSTDFNDLFRAIGPTWGSRDPKQSFLIPDLRGLFLRGWAHAGSQKNPDKTPREPQFSADPNGRVSPRTASDVGTGGSQGNSGDSVGSEQQDELQDHRHSLGHFGFAQIKSECGNGCGALVNITGTGNTESISSGRNGSETRPSNAYVMYFIFVGQDVSNINPATGKLIATNEGSAQSSK